MIRITTFLIISILGIAVSFAQIKTEEILIKNNNIELPGTLSFSDNNSPLIIWIHGSGNIDRNGNQGSIVKANYIQQFRNQVNKSGVSFFSYDKRTANRTNAQYLKNITFNDFINDVKKVINHFKDDNRFSKIILVGHSQGSLIAMMSLQNIDKYISLSGPSETIDKTMIQQISAQNDLLGKAAAEHFKELNETGEIKNVNPLLVSIFSKPNLAFLKSWAAINPIEEIKKIKIPTLIINGTKDLQVKVEDAKALHQAKPSSKLVIIENMNHVLKNIEKDEDNMKSYYSSDFQLSEKLIKTVVNFVKK